MQNRLALLTIIGIILRFINLSDKPPWTDEFSTLVFSLGNSFLGVPLNQPIPIDTLLQPLQPTSTTVKDVLTHLFSESNHPPLYFILTHLWLKLFPSEGGLVSLWGARSLAAIFGAISVPAIYSFSFLTFRSRLVSQIAAAIMATSPFGIFLAQETRHYTLPILWVIASLACLIIATRHLDKNTKIPIKVVAAWIAVNALGIATHYFFVLTLFAEVMVLIFLGWQQWRQKSLIFSRWWRIVAVGLGTAISGLIWVPVFLQNTYGGKLTEWIQGDRIGLAWISPLFQAFAAWVTMLFLLPVEAPNVAIMIVCGVIMLIFAIWITPILIGGIRIRLKQPKTQLETQILIGFIASAIALFFFFTYFLGIDLTRGARYNFVYFPAVIVLLGTSLAICARAKLVKLYKWKVSGQQAIALVYLMSFLSAITVVCNLGYQKYYRPDLFVELIQNTSKVPVLIATTQKTHVHIGEMMGVARELKIHPKPSNSLNYQFLLAHQDADPNTSTAALETTMKNLPRPLDLWMVNFYADNPKTIQICEIDKNPSFPGINGYDYKLYHCL
ncbi:hypothetical protein [Calothrix sp. PCC 6303]|uniref:glycosyltransferase family 39 protein n=1 Tax=Calothrix sp. PCC 6303 TaxID=1170562 RepID=UPI0002A02FBD|nr:hypothetical protein [Calothrix sp. PCC 6303]AFZ02463.1 hypothetical protein Cal6303_3531 [Calothrix sp. PCC 6303]